MFAVCRLASLSDAPSSPCGTAPIDNLQMSIYASGSY
jgi:hypothetical protein